jgi:acyl dehydratase
VDGRFYPENLGFFAFVRSIPLAMKQEFQACVQCGHVWNHVDPEALRKLLLKRRAGKPVLHAGLAGGMRVALLTVLGLLAMTALVVMYWMIFSS